MIKNVNKLWKQVTPADVAKGVSWYTNVYRNIRMYSDRTGYSPVAIAGVIAVTSPRVKWTKQMETLPEILELHSCKKFSHILQFGLNKNFQKAIHILDGQLPSEVIKGRKVMAFYHNLIGDLDSITLDVWMWRIVGLKVPPYPKHKLWDEYESIIRSIAKTEGLKPAQVQAILWIAAKRQNQLEMEL